MGQDRKVIYLDHLTLAPPSSRVLKAWEEGRQLFDYDVTAPYQMGGQLSARIDQSIDALYELVGASANDRFFFAESEARLSSDVMMSLLIDEMYHTGKNHLIAPATEKASILRVMDRLKEIGCTFTLLEVDQAGQISVQALEKAVTPRTALLAMSWVDGLLGTIRPVWDLAEFCRERGIITYIQASEIFAKLFFRFQDLPIDYLSFSGELIHAPKGTAGLFVKKGSKAPVISYPLGSRMATFEGGHPADVIALGEAAAELLDLMDSMCMEVAHLRNRFEGRLEKGIDGITFFAHEASRVPNISCFAIEGIHAELLLFHLMHEGVLATLGGGQRQKLEHVLTAGGIPEEQARGAISLSFSFQTSEKESDEAADRIIEVAQRLQKRIGALV